MDTTAVLGMSAFVVGITQIVKDLQLVSGNNLKIVAILAAALEVGARQYFPEAWDAMQELAIALTTTGIVSFAKGMVK